MQALAGPGHGRVAVGCGRRDGRRAAPDAISSGLTRRPSRACPAQQWQIPQQRKHILARSEEPERSSFGFELLGPNWSNRARLSEEMLNSLMELPGTRGMYDLRTRADALTTWKMALQRGTLPKMNDVDWPQEPFKTKFAEALRNMEMPRFTRRYPAILDTLIRQMLVLAQDFEEKLKAAEESQQAKQQQQSQSQRSQGQQNQEQQQQQQQSQEASAAGGGGADQQQEGEQQQQEMEMNEEELQQAMQEAMEQAKNQNKQQQQGQGMQIQIKMQDIEGDAKKQGDQGGELEKQLEQIAEDIVKNFEAQMSEVMENLETGEMAFDDLSSLLEGGEGFDMSKGTWRRSGWRELNALREVLEKVPELRELVRQLGRGGGKGPLRRAPEEVEARGYPPGVIRSPLQPEEVRGLTRSGELSRMLPAEMALLAHGWPRKRRSAGEASGAQVGAAAGAAAERTGRERAGASSARASVAASSPSSSPSSSSADDSPPHVPVVASVDSDEFDLEEYYLPGAHAARLLHRVRRAERMLLSYDRTGWLEDEPARVTSRLEIRPAAELGPIILCLDTSGSMRGARETVAKALALECLRGAHRQRRQCYLYAFSGPNEVQELELRHDVESLDSLLSFLSCSFSGGTDVDAPLKLSLERLAQAEWSQADILMVTDGEIPNPDSKIIDAIARASSEMGLEVHGLLVSSHVTDAMRKLCSQVHVFKSWSAVPGGNDYMYS